MSRKKIIQVSESQVGTKESPPGTNKNPYGKWYGFNGYPWCAMFVSWVYDQAGHPLGRIDDDKGYRDCKSAYNHWKRTGEITKDPHKGDIVLFDWNNDGKCDHTGIFNEWLDSKKIQFSAYEGNTAKGDDSDGGIVMLREDRYASSVKAFVSPRVLTSKNISLQPEDVVSLGDRNATVAQLQKQLFDLGYPITVDGIFGPKTQKIIQRFQKDQKLPVTGQATPAVMGYIESQIEAKNIDLHKIQTGTFLKYGNSGNAVLRLQKALNNNEANLGIKEDGVFGKETQTALKAFQKAKRIKSDGIAGPITLKALQL